MSKDIVLEVKNITKQFPGTLALNDVSLSVKRGEAMALVGENGAGKSTLMNIVSGVLQADKGSIYLDGEEIVLSNPREAMEKGIGFVHQELSLCNHLTVAENLFMSDSKKVFVDFKELNRQSAELISKFNANFSPNEIVDRLTVAQQQIIEIAKALTRDTKVLIFDEPTASLTEREIVELFKVINDLKANGIAVLYISHRLDEVFQICERVTILKDGCCVGTYNTEDINHDDLVKGMVGRNIENLYPDKSDEISDPIFEIKDFTAKNKRYKDVSFQLRKGEILGFYGLVGAGRTELMRGICGIDAKISGEVFFYGKKTDNSSFIKSIKNGIVYITENRKEEGLFLAMTIQRNLSVVVLKKVLKGLFLNDAKEEEIATKYSNELKAKVQGLQYHVSTLSGGNQQKIMVGKWLAATPQLIIMDEPTRGIDVGAKFEIHKMLRDMANTGLGIIVISSDLPEIIGLSDRVIVMSEGIVKGELTADEMTEERIISMAS